MTVSSTYTIKRPARERVEPGCLITKDCCRHKSPQADQKLKGTLAECRLKPDRWVYHHRWPKWFQPLAVAGSPWQCNDQFGVESICISKCPVLYSCWVGRFQARTARRVWSSGCHDINGRALAQRAGSRFMDALRVRGPSLDCGVTQFRWRKKDEAWWRMDGDLIA